MSSELHKRPCRFPDLTGWIFYFDDGGARSTDFCCPNCNNGFNVSGHLEAISDHLEVFLDNLIIDASIVQVVKIKNSLLVIIKA